MASATDWDSHLRLAAKHLRGQASACHLHWELLGKKHLQVAASQHWQASAGWGWQLFADFPEASDCVLLHSLS